VRNLCSNSLRLVVEFYHVVLPKDASCFIYCDSKAALARVQDTYYEGFGTTWRCHTHYDLEAAIKHCLKQLSFSFSWHRVRGHASRRKQPEDFTFAETLNEAADDLATLARQGRALDHDDDHWPEQVVSVIGPRGPRMCGRVARELRFCCTAGDLLSYWQHPYLWNASLVSLVDLFGTKKAISKLSPDSLPQVQKLRCGWLPVYTRVSREDPDRLSGCSACSPVNFVSENVDHIFQCSCTARRSAILQRLSDLSEKFREWKTSKLLIHALHTGALAWIEQREPHPVESLGSLFTLFLNASKILYGRGDSTRLNLTHGSTLNGFGLQGPADVVKT
jgi:hypothetical protein